MNTSPIHTSPIHTIVLLFACLVAHISFAQDIELPEVRIPQLPPTGARMQDFVPEGWDIELSESGDLGGDGSLKDHLVLLRMQDPRNRFEDGGCTLDSNPRLLAFLLARDGQYFLAGQNSTLIPRPDQFCNGSDPIDGVVDGEISIGGERGREGTLSLGFFGGGTLGHVTLSFAWLGDGSNDRSAYAVHLLKWVRDSTSRHDLSRRVIHVDYLKQRITCLEYGDDDRLTREQTHPLVSDDGAPPPLLRLDDVGNAYDFPWNCAFDDGSTFGPEPFTGG